MSSTRSITWMFAAVLFLASVASCQQTGALDKAGGNVLALRFVTIDDLNSNGQSPAPGVFIQALEHLSGGRIKVTVTSQYETGAAGAETDVVKAIASGTFDGGWPDTRAFSRAGIPSLESVEAPMTLTNYAAEKALATGTGGTMLLDSLKGSGVIGLGLAVGPLRRPFATTDALSTLQGWRGVTFRSLNSPVQDATIRALGGVPVEASFNFPDLVYQGKLNGAETDVAQYDLNAYGALLPWAVDNLVLWPRMQVLSLSQKRFNSLTRTQRGWVTAAARQAVQAAADYPYNDDNVAARLCDQGVRFVDAQPAQLAAMKHAVQPVIATLAADPATSQSLGIVQGVAAAFPTVGAIHVPTSCQGP